MTEERDLESGLEMVALPFASGVTCAIFSKDFLSFQPTYPASVLHAACLVTATAIALLYDKKQYSYLLPPLTFAVCFICGLSVGLSGIILDISDTQCIIREFSTSAKAIITKKIDSIGFESQDTGPLVKALLAGDKSGLSKEIKYAFRNSGASHILALSGMHLGIIYSIIAGLLRLSGQSKMAVVAKSSILIALCGTYTIATGATPSLTRAFIFILLRETARITSRSMELKNILCTSIIIHLTTAPTSIGSIGFQLSYAAMVGIAYIFPIINNIWPLKNGKNQEFHLLHKIWEISALSLACQLTAGVASWIYFGSFPKYFLITNLIALPLTSFIIPAALFTLVFNYFGADCIFLRTITDKASEILIYSLSTISSLPGNS